MTSQDSWWGGCPPCILEPQQFTLLQIEIQSQDCLKPYENPTQMLLMLLTSITKDEHIISKQQMGHSISSPPPSAENPAKKPPFLALHRIQERASMAIMKRYRDRRPPCLKPLVLRKKFDRVPLISTDNQAVEMHHFIHLIN